MFEYKFPMAANAVTMIAHSFVDRDSENPRTKILIGKRSDDTKAHPGEWSLPGGFLEVGKETLEKAASREFKEETDLETQPGDWELLGVSDKPGNDKRYDQVINVIFGIEIHNSWLGKEKANDDLKELEWVSLVEAAERVTAFEHKEIIVQFMEEIGG